MQGIMEVRAMDNVIWSFVGLAKFRNQAGVPDSVATLPSSKGDVFGFDRPSLEIFTEAPV